MMHLRKTRWLKKTSTYLRALRAGGGETAAAAVQRAVEEPEICRLRLRLDQREVGVGLGGRGGVME
jgi:hypothetical protein